MQAEPEARQPDSAKLQTAAAAAQVGILPGIMPDGAAAAVLAAAALTMVAVAVLVVRMVAMVYQHRPLVVQDKELQQKSLQKLREQYIPVVAVEQILVQVELVAVGQAGQETVMPELLAHQILAVAAVAEVAVALTPEVQAVLVFM